MSLSLHQRLTAAACRMMVLTTRHQASLPQGVADEMLEQLMALFGAVEDVALVEALVAEIAHRRPSARVLTMWRGLGAALRRALRPAAPTFGEMRAAWRAEMRDALAGRVSRSSSGIAHAAPAACAAPPDRGAPGHPDASSAAGGHQ